MHKTKLIHIARGNLILTIFVLTTAFYYMSVINLCIDSYLRKKIKRLPL